MAITEQRPPIRKSVGWYGGSPPDSVNACFAARKLELIPCADEQLADPVFLSEQAAIIFCQQADKPSALTLVLEKNAGRLLDHDCQVIVQVITADRSFPNAVRNLASRLAAVCCDSQLPVSGVTVFPPAIQKQAGFDPRVLEPFPHIRFYSEFANWNEIANEIVCIRPDKGPNLQLQITRDRDIELNHEQILFLQRAFSDCANVHLVTMDDEGKSGGVVFRAYADLKDDLLGINWPQPYFVKIGSRSKIIQEYRNYQAVVDPYIPFHLGPHLVDHRCHLGAQFGILVGDFVEKSESLGGCAAHGRAAQAIGSLFTHTLEGWYRAATERADTPLSTFLKFPRNNWSQQRLSRAQALGAKMGLDELKQLYRKSDEADKLLIGPAHGDLHSANVLVRAYEAIVIDFGAHRNMPLVFDAACLEASLVVDGFKNDSRAAEEWLRSILPLYTTLIFECPTPISHPKDDSFWFYSCVAQIRLHARHMERGRGQYAAALAIALLRKANKDGGAQEPEESRRAAAYVLAERVLISTFGPATVSSKSDSKTAEHISA